METNPNEWVTAAERIVAKSLGWGIVVLVIATFLLLGFANEFLEKPMLNGVPYSLTKISFLVAAGLLSVGLVVWIWQLVLKLARMILALIANKRAQSAKIKKDMENISYLTKEAKLMLLGYLMLPSDRFPSPGNLKSVDQLIKYELVEFEKLSSHWQRDHHGEFLKIVPSLVAVRESVKMLLIDALRPHYTGDLGDRNILVSHLEKVFAKQISAQ